MNIKYHISFIIIIIYYYNIIIYYFDILYLSYIIYFFKHELFKTGLIHFFYNHNINLKYFIKITCY